jgi:DNA-binding MarR family transcriptional regulator
MQSTPARTQALAEALVALWGRVMRAGGGNFLAELEQHDLSMTQLKALHVLKEHGELSVKAVGEALGLSLPAASRAVDGLVQRGFVARAECASDRRSRLVTLSPDGDAVIGRVSDARITGIANFVGTLTDDEREALSAALLPILERTRP